MNVEPKKYKSPCELAYPLTHLRTYQEGIRNKKAGELTKYRLCSTLAPISSLENCEEQCFYV